MAATPPMGWNSWNHYHCAVNEAILRNMSKRASELLQDDLEAKGPVRISEVEAAQKEILTIARRMADAGEIMLGGKGGEEMV